MKDDTNCDALEDNDSTRKIIERNVEEIDMLKVWKDDCSVYDIIRLHSHDGFVEFTIIFLFIA